MAHSNLPLQADLRKRLSYDQSTGVLTWLPRAIEDFGVGKRSPSHIANQWNSRCAGKPAFNYLGARGYLTGTLDGKIFYAHHVIWKWMIGENPFGEIDHIDGDRANNRWCNLRCCTTQDNARNRGIHPKNKTGFPGVQWRDDFGKYIAMITINYKTEYLGSFDSLEDAIDARLIAEAGVFHENHGLRPSHIKASKT